jgi:hypothetical protein
MDDSDHEKTLKHLNNKIQATYIFRKMKDKMNHLLQSHIEFQTTS